MGRWVSRLLGNSVVFVSRHANVMSCKVMLITCGQSVVFGGCLFSQPPKNSSKCGVNMLLKCRCWPLNSPLPSNTVSALDPGLMRITANPGRSGSKPIESRLHWCTNAHTYGAAPRAKHVTIQKWRRRRVCFVHRQLSKFPIDILSLARSSQPWYSIRMSFTFACVETIIM